MILSMLMKSIPMNWCQIFTVSGGNKIINWLLLTKITCVFTWFMFTLKPPYTIAHGNFLLAIWDTSHWTSFVKFELNTA